MGRQRLQTPEARRQKFYEANSSKQRLQAATLVQPDETPRSPQRAWMREQESKSRPAKESDSRAPSRPRSLDVFSRGLEEDRVVHACGTRRLAGKASKAVAQFVGENVRYLERAVRDCAHQRNASTRAVPLAVRRVVCRARRQAHTAVHALL